MASTSELTKMAAKAFGFNTNDLSGGGNQVLSALGGNNNKPEIQEGPNTADLAKAVVNLYNPSVGGRVDNTV